MNVTIGDKKTFDDWGLKLQNLVVGMPEAKTNLKDIPGADGVLDLTDAMGTVRYGNRELQMVFDITGELGKWHGITSEIANYLHGQKLKVILDTDPYYYYIGRLSLDSGKSDCLMNRITISGNMDPYKYELQSSLEDWLWNPFNFRTGIIRNYKNLQVKGSRTVNIIGRRKPIVPTITASASMTVTFLGKQYSIQPGEQKVYEISITEGDNYLIFTGNGTISIDYRGGIL